MSLLIPEERRDLKKSRIARFYEMEEQFYTVTEFYPAQRLTIHVNLFNIMDIMNCDTETARGLLKKIGKEVSNEFTPSLRTSDFCDYMDIDEMLIQVFLASLNTYDVPFPPVETLPALTIAEIARERPRKIYEVMEDLRDGIMESSETLELRGKLWEEANPNGEAMYKRKKWVQMGEGCFIILSVLLRQ